MQAEDAQATDSASTSSFSAPVVTPQTILRSGRPNEVAEERAKRQVVHDNLMPNSGSWQEPLPRQET